VRQGRHRLPGRHGGTEDSPESIPNTAQVSDAGQSSAAAQSRHERWVDLLQTILLAVATVATAWSGYQAARWSGVQAINFSAANAARVQSSQASTRAGQLTQIDVATFIQWVDAYQAKNRQLADFYFDRFRPEFKPAVNAWIASRPLKSPNAAPTPFVLPQYRVAEQTRADRLSAQASAATEQAKRDNQRSDNYVLAVVLFASSLFFAGISTKLGSPATKTAILALGWAVLVGTVIWVLTFPVTVSV
jgi:hypothetical protein